MAFDFSKLEVGQASVWLEMPEVTPRAKILLKPATTSNPAYFNAMLRKGGRRMRQIVRTDRVTTEELDLNRDQDRELFPRYVIMGWEGIEEEDGKLVPFSRERCEEFCNKLPDWLFDRIRNFAATPEHFLPEGEDPAPDPEELLPN